MGGRKITSLLSNISIEEANTWPPETSMIETLNITIEPCLTQNTLTFNASMRAQNISIPSIHLLFLYNLFNRVQIMSPLMALYTYT